MVRNLRVVGEVFVGEKNLGTITLPFEQFGETPLVDFVNDDAGPLAPGLR